MSVEELKIAFKKLIDIHIDVFEITFSEFIAEHYNSKCLIDDKIEIMNAYEDTSIFEASSIAIFEELIESIGEYHVEYASPHYDNLYVIYYFPKHDIYLKFVGTYDSYSGTKFSEKPIQVWPKQITQTIYVTKEEKENLWS